ncbi:cyclic pyranopterin phosphate synthase MoaA [Candidatus Epulonipiscium fishelsonii]|uniref:Cyclic pyranopterin phosphate synthase MoaA n=1 Tax=Candidatus Epulonipiscium fishelsonii TaxID=77094 RepID=A0ACC8XBQ2_9FIRM|nr:cyclic pyranopterin phosphate synthase MoaA [Epulopiscium sp. SCG-D08WGA-EpuloA1]OON90544.1 MAG: cyclic pyranopterin phosphate synthase MoaA [Epulopiscium sp. AS2M-Bin002]
MQDKYDRTIDYARISVTDRCNFKCNYCAPNEIESIDTSLTHSEILSLCQSLVQIGINKIKITGGEPFLRDDIIDIIRDIKNLNGIKEVTITTNGFLLGNYLEQLKEIGIDGINISIDAMDKELFHKITKVDCFDTIFDTIKKTQALGLKNIKLNCVLIKGCNEQEYTKLAKLVQQYDICVKYIEMMPIGKGKDFEQYSLEELKKILENEFGSLTEIVNENSNGPATYYTIDGAKGKIGMIGAITHKFCKNCNRIRITSQGELKTCLQYNAKVNLRKYIFSNYITKMIRSEILNKPESHRFNENSIFDEEIKSMIEIGG